MKQTVIKYVGNKKEREEIDVPEEKEEKAEKPSKGK